MNVREGNIILHVQEYLRITRVTHCVQILWKGIVLLLQSSTYFIMELSHIHKFICCLMSMMGHSQSQRYGCGRITQILVSHANFSHQNIQNQPHNHAEIYFSLSLTDQFLSRKLLLLAQMLHRPLSPCATLPLPFLLLSSFLSPSLFFFFFQVEEELHYGPKHIFQPK